MTNIFDGIKDHIKMVDDLRKDNDELKQKLNAINAFHYNIKVGKHANMKRAKIIEQLGILVFCDEVSE
jgi:hypothetical protein